MRNVLRPVLILAAAFFATLPLSSSADVYEDGMVAYNAGRYSDALGIWKWLADTGNVDAAFNLGFMYEFGYGVQANDADAFAWYQRAAEGGNQQAQRYVAWMYEHGKGVRQDRVESRKWLLMADANAEDSATSREAKFKQEFYERLCAEFADAEARYDVQQRQPNPSTDRLEASAQVS